MKRPANTRRTAVVLAMMMGLAMLFISPSSVSAASEADSPLRVEREQERVAVNAVRYLALGRTSMIDRAFQDDFVDHETGETGTDALRANVEEHAEAYPYARTRTVYRVVSEGDLVFVHSHLLLEPDTRGYAVADIYRFEDGKIAEHWGGEQAVPETTASGNDMFSTLSSPRRFSPDPQADTEETKAVLGALGYALVVEKDLTAWDTYTAPPYYQHSTNTPNGVEAVKEIWGQLLIDPEVTVAQVNGLTEGDLSVSQNRISGPGLELLTFDISRVIDGKIVEHWDIVQSVG